MYDRTSIDRPLPVGRTEIGYRADIDGLRAVAVLAVVFYHFHIGPFSGGYVGVDEFFVISGFLITAVIHTEIRQGNFTIAGFYERRVRRILPALLLVAAASAVLAYVFFLPADLRTFSESLVAMALFASNFEFWREAGYFDTLAEFKPLLHTWSLAVEEQFYVVFPIVLFLARRASDKALLLIIGAILAGSLVLSIWDAYRHPDMTFYLLPTRMWELMVGAMLAVAEPAGPKNRLAANVLALAGVAMIAIATFSYTDATPFPGTAALLPCLGTALLIYVGTSSGSLVNQVLATRAFVAIGLISYSLYLWHWPLYVFARYASLGSLSPGLVGGLLALSFALAWLSWRYVEQPFRGRRGLFGRPALFRLAAAASAVAMLFGGMAFATGGMPSRFSPDVLKIAAAVSEFEPRQDQCFNLRSEQVRPDRLCRIGAAKEPPSFVLWGDSHADAMMEGVSDAAARHGLSGYFAAVGACLPFVGVDVVNNKAGHDCLPFNENVLRLIKKENINTVFLVARWAVYTNTLSWITGDPIKVLLKDGTSQQVGPAQNAEVFLRGLRRTVNALSTDARHIVIVNSVPEIGVPVPFYLSRAKARGSDVGPISTLEQYRRIEGIALDAFAAVEKRNTNVTVLRPEELLCPNSKCIVIADGLVLYRDDTHLTTSGAKFLSPLFDSIFAGAAHSGRRGGS